MRAFAVVCTLPLFVQQPDGLQTFKTWLQREHPGFHSDEGPARFRNTTVEAVYPGRRFYYVLTYTRGVPPPFPNMLSLVAEVDDRGAVIPVSLTSVATYRAGLRPVTTSKDARQVAAAVLILAFGDPGQRRWAFEPDRFTVAHNKKGWACSYPHGFSYASQVTFDKRGALSAINPNAPPVP